MPFGILIPVDLHLLPARTVDIPHIFFVAGAVRYLCVHSRAVADDTPVRRTQTLHGFVVGGAPVMNVHLAMAFQTSA